VFSAFKTRDYRLLFIGQAISHLGDQFHLIALPWLVFGLTQDPLHLGLVLASAGIPRAVILLVGGAYADRHSPRLMMLASDLLRSALTLGIAMAILTGSIRIWMVYAMAITSGIGSGFFLPAAEATLPRLLQDHQLESGNALLMGTNQFATFLGPALASLLIASLGSKGGQSSSLAGAGVAFLVDGCSFLASMLSLASMRRMPGLNPQTITHPFAEILAALRYAWSSPRIRGIVLLLAMANFLIAGPVFVGIPVLAKSRLVGGPGMLGIIFSASGLGSLVGMIAAASLPRVGERLFAWMVITLMAAFSASMVLLAFVSATRVIAPLMFAIGIGNGYIAVTAMTSLQRSIPKAYLGRVMALVMLAVVGLMPLSQALAGVVVRRSLPAIFEGAGLGFAILAILSFWKKSTWPPEADSKEGPEGGLASWGA